MLIDKLQGVDLRGIISVKERLYRVASFNSNREIYQCYLGDGESLPTCSCWFDSAYTCKHFFAIFLKENLTWSAFNTSYPNSPYFILDLCLENNEHATSPQQFLHSSNILLQNNLVAHAKSMQDLPIESCVQTVESVQDTKENNTELNCYVKNNHPFLKNVVNL